MVAGAPMLQFRARLSFTLGFSLLLIASSTAFHSYMLHPLYLTHKQQPLVGSQDHLGTALHSTRSELSSRTSSLSGNLISQLAVLAIQFCLKSYGDVSCDVSSVPQELFQGKIGPVTVKGKNWSSSRGLTCRAIEASVESCQLDISRVFSEQTLVLTSPAEGRSMIALTAQDFGNFVTHPRLEKAKQKAAAEFAAKLPSLASTPNVASPLRIDFSEKNVSIDPQKGCVTFYATFAGISCKCALRRDNIGGVKERPKALVEVTSLHAGNKSSIVTASRLSQVFTHFFNQMVFELYDGLFLSFRDMMVTDRGKEPSVLLSLNIRVEKFPSTAIRPSSF